MKNHSEKCAYANNKYDFCDCDGYHTFGELYEHRIELFIALAKVLKRQENEIVEKTGRCTDGNSFVWRSKRHSDGEIAFDWNLFVLGLGTFKDNQITYHLPIDRWDETDFAETLEKAPEWDGHTSDDVLERLKKL